MPVYRFEHENGLGPYTNLTYPCLKDLVNKGVPIHQGHEHPSDYEDLGRNIYLDEFCGFHKKSLISKWFTKKEINVLLQAGYKIKKYTPKSYIVGKSGKQCFFKKNDNE